MSQNPHFPVFQEVQVSPIILAYAAVCICMHPAQTSLYCQQVKYPPHTPPLNLTFLLSPRPLPQSPPQEKKNLSSHAFLHWVTDLTPTKCALGWTRTTNDSRPPRHARPGGCQLQSIYFRSGVCIEDTCQRPSILFLHPNVCEFCGSGLSR